MSTTSRSGLGSFLVFFLPNIPTLVMLPLSKINKARHKVIRADFSQQYTVAIGKRLQHDMNSTFICTEVIGHFKVSMRE